MSLIAANECLGMGFVLVGGDILDLVGGFVLVVVEVKVDGF